MSKRIERCFLCDEPTGRAGKAEDSLYKWDDGSGPYCELCWEESTVWLDAHRYDAMYDPDNCSFDRDETKPLGPNACHLYVPREIRISWGEWGPEHITVPGNACGLDVEYGYSFGAPPGGKVLLPHNVDSIYQASLLIVVFLFFADTLILHRLCEQSKKAGSLVLEC